MEGLGFDVLGSVVTFVHEGELSKQYSVELTLRLEGEERVQQHYGTGPNLPSAIVKALAYPSGRLIVKVDTFSAWESFGVGRENGSAAIVELTQGEHRGVLGHSVNQPSYLDAVLLACMDAIALINKRRALAWSSLIPAGLSGELEVPSN